MPLPRRARPRRADRGIAPKLRRTVVFNGDTDPCVSYEGTRRAIERVGFATVAAYRPWFYDHPAAALGDLAQLPVTFGLDLRARSTGVQRRGKSRVRPRKYHE